MKIFKTPKGKEITMFNEGYSIRLKFTSGGELPASLAGKFTASDIAETAILKYLDGLEKKQKIKE